MKAYNYFSFQCLQTSADCLKGQYSVFTAFLEIGDEVIMFEPFFDQYLPSVTFNGGKPVYVPLHPPTGSSTKPTSNEWTIDLAELRYVIDDLFFIEGLLTVSDKSGNYSSDKDDHCQYPTQPRR